ncbi:hypothetical protein ATANTOWER_024812 [Ataeniobius toweri]|uniref:Uncharacterized protein n=1 Tax=Ataeniobius toweri TaxID=208326 RepID=A0ABU7BRF5_9TELE|nr:hypothetical protein [Ataeniobius toweri]
MPEGEKKRHISFLNYTQVGGAVFNNILNQLIKISCSDALTFPTKQYHHETACLDWKFIVLTRTIVCGRREQLSVIRLPASGQTGERFRRAQISNIQPKTNLTMIRSLQFCKSLSSFLL